MKPSKEEIENLIKLYAIRLKYDDPEDVRKAQKCYDSFYEYYLKFSDKYYKYDFISTEFWDTLEVLAQKYMCSNKDL